MTEAEIRELVGEIIIAGFEGTEVTHHAQRLIRRHQVKNIILFKRNVESAGQLAGLNAALQSIAKDSGHVGPLIICTDQENGIVRRVAPGLPGLPGNMAIGATGNVRNAYETGTLTAKQLLSVGVNMDLAPVLDVNNNPENPVIGVRSYGENPDLVADFGTAMIRGLQEWGVIACGKHFPGHGDTSVDSHLALPEIAHDRKRLQEVELKPFLKAMEFGVDVVMTAHIVFSSIEQEKIPATLSKAVLTDFLRSELKYEGVITTDCLEMNAISETVGVAEGAVQALLAGADWLMISHRLDRQEAAIEAIVKSVLDGRVPETRLAEAANRVRNLRRNRVADVHHSGVENGPSVPAKGLLDESNELQRRLCAEAATVVVNSRGLVPLDHGEVKVIDLFIDSGVTRMSASDNTSSSQFVVSALQETFPKASLRVHNIAEGVTPSLARELANTSLIVAGISGRRNEDYLQFVNEIGRNGQPVVALALQSPYVLKDLSDVPTQVAIYEYTEWMVQAGINALVGRGGTGQLPITL
ncbi:beta-N-acetylhexosaminidase [Alicyclobacillus sp. SO9]|uniref:beta-N-acetylhexosaminidase n=1 Tax=Alicyclobacillus sp. SO9 TaxID=2665646 RepID=UPI0018E72A90|nr:beta-N-acetylhexosaminidase [Alicyclobacillus sp. SO9]QQE79193.1 beta-N-acetylhexosaminidase [Alicyclobacillus sp. SO9]